MDNNNRILIISPIKNEIDYLEKTLAGICSQTLPPVRWIIMDDQSTDGSKELAESYAGRFPFIEVLSVQQNQERTLGPRVVANVNKALAHADQTQLEYDYICKLDGDLEFVGEHILQSIIDMFERQPKLGICGPDVLLRLENGRQTIERHAPYHVMGCFKVYRRRCFEQMHGLFEVYGWDLADEVNARRLGWHTEHSTEVQVIHLRVQGSALGSIKGRRVWGWGAYATCNYLPFAILRGFYRMFDPPYFIGGLAFIWGYLEAKFQGVKRISDPEFCRYIKKEHKNRLLSFNKKL